MSDWTRQIVDAARAALAADRDLAIVLWPNGRGPELYGQYKLAHAKPGEIPSAKLRPYFATVAKLTGNNFNGYVVVRYGNKIVVYIAPDTILARGEAA